MPHPIEASILRILKPTGETVGTGFLVSKNLAVTCAHVVKILGASAGDTIDIRFTGKSAATTARVLPEYWRPDDSTDIAILQVDETPAGVFPLRMARASESRLKNDLYIFGYATAGDEQGIGGLGTFITLKQEGNFIQFRMHEANHGHSGAPIYDDKRGVVVGMIKKGHTGSGRNAETTFAIPTETIWQVCPQLKLPTPILPRRNPIVEGINLLPYDYDQRIQNFLTEYLGTNTHPVPFGGRDDALKMLDDWLAETTPYLLLAAPAGRGKSALLVRWLDSLKEREDLALAFLPVSIRFGTNMERVFYAALSARLAHLHGDDIPASPETSTAVYRGLVSDYLSKPLANGQTLLVVLDGLDEAADWQAGAGFMPAELPVGVRVVVSARFLSGDTDSTAWLRRLNWERNGLASAPSLTPLDQEGVRDVLFKMGCPLDELSRNVDIVAELYRLSGGDPLLVGLYVGDLWAKGEAVTRLKPEDLASIQPGYKGYFDRWWEDQKKLWGKEAPLLEKRVQLVFDLLAGAMGGLSKSDLRALDTENILSIHIMEFSIDSLKRFVIGIPDERRGNEVGYILTHPKLHDYFWNKLTIEERTELENRFINWGERILQALIANNLKPNETPPYLLQYYSAHLERAWVPFEKWLPLIDNPHWHQAWFSYEGAYGGYMQDVTRVWKTCGLLNVKNLEQLGQPLYLAKEIRCAVIEASLHSLAGNIFPQLLAGLIKNKIWSFPQALVYIRQMYDEKQKADSIIALLHILTETQVAEILTVVKTLEDAKELARVLTELSKYLPESKLIETLILVQRLKKVDKKEDQRATILTNLALYMPEHTLKTILNKTIDFKIEKERASILKPLAKRVPDPDLDEFLAITQNFQNPYWRAFVLSEVAQRKPSLWNEFLASVVMIRDEEAKAKQLQESTQYFPRGIFNKIAEIAKKFAEKVNSVHVLHGLAQLDPSLWKDTIDIVSTLQQEKELTKALCEVTPNLPEEHLSTVHLLGIKIRDINSRALVLFELSKRMPQLQTSLLPMIREMDLTRERIRLLISVAQDQPELWTDVLDNISKIDDVEISVDILRDVADKIPVDRVPEVALMVNNISHGNHDDNLRIDVLFELAKRVPEYWRETIASVRALAEWKRADVLCKLAEFLPEQLLDEALIIAKGIRYQKDYARVIEKLAERKPIYWDEILSTAMEIKDYDECLMLMNTIELQSYSSMPRKVLSVAQTIPDEWDRSRILNEFVNFCPESMLGEVLNAAREIHNPEYRAYVINALACRLPNLYEQELVITQNIKNEWLRAETISFLIPQMPETLIDKIIEIVLNTKAEWAQAIILMSLAKRHIRSISTKTLQISQNIQNQWARACILSELAQGESEPILGEVLETVAWLNDWECGLVLKNLSTYLPKNSLDKALSICREIKNMKEKARVLSIYVNRRPIIYDDALKAALAIPEKADKVNAISNLIAFQPKLLTIALVNSRALENHWERLHVLRNLEQHIPANLTTSDLKDTESSIRNMIKALSEMLIADSVAQKQKEAESFIPLMVQETEKSKSETDPTEPSSEEWNSSEEIGEDGVAHTYIPNSLKQQLHVLAKDNFSNTWDIKNPRELVGILSTLAYEENLEKLSQIKRYEILTQSLIILSMQQRKDLVSNLQALLSPITAAGSESVSYEIYEAVRDVTTWWP